MHAKQNTEPLLIFNFFFYRFHLHTLSDRKAKLKNTRQVSNSQFFFKNWSTKLGDECQCQSIVNWSQLIDWLLIILLSARNYFFRMETSPFAVKGCTNLGLCSAHISFEHRGILNSATSVVTRATGFWRNHPKDRRIKSAESPEAPPH